MKPIILFLSLNFCISAFAWNSVAHRIIAQIAYDQLTPTARVQVDALTATMFHSRYPEARFARASTWPDQIKNQTSAYNQWHYINLPYVKNNVHARSVHAENVVWAILRAEKIVADSSENKYRRAKYLNFLAHFIGDIEQPLHCATLYDTQFPQGDRGGNDYAIHSPIADNLHQLWDKGLGLFVSDQSHYQFHYKQIQKIAADWMQDYPRTVFATQLTQQNPLVWAQESHEIAVTFVYSISLHATPSASYLSQGQKIIRKQIVLAGDRLADTLNHLFST